MEPAPLAPERQILKEARDERLAELQEQHGPNSRRVLLYRAFFDNWDHRHEFECPRLPPYKTPVMRAMIRDVYGVRTEARTYAALCNVIELQEKEFLLRHLPNMQLPRAPPAPPAADVDVPAVQAMLDRARDAILQEMRAALGRVVDQMSRQIAAATKALAEELTKRIAEAAAASPAASPGFGGPAAEPEPQPAAPAAQAQAKVAQAAADAQRAQQDIQDVQAQFQQRVDPALAAGQPVPDTADLVRKHEQAVAALAAAEQAAREALAELQRCTADAAQQRAVLQESERAAAGLRADLAAAQQGLIAEHTRVDQQALAALASEQQIQEFARELLARLVPDAAMPEGEVQPADILALVDRAIAALQKQRGSQAGTLAELVQPPGAPA